ncbi:hypothetical protein OIO90_001996 [Microbotryomycetes sp. JL221]|nr:hypothetical protein OIO90_001996 [Microbotryomycetes sp. JL221]
MLGVPVIDTLACWQLNSGSGSGSAFVKRTNGAVEVVPASNVHEAAPAGLHTPLTPSRTAVDKLDNQYNTVITSLHLPSPLMNANNAAGAAPAGRTAATTVSPLADFFATMFVWMWHRPSNDAPSYQVDMASRLQVKPTDRFLKFMHDVLTTTQVSHSIALLALLYCSKLKSANQISGAPGSEFRSSVVALMMANKVLDDNTYTAKTWADVSGLELAPLIVGEQEFLKGLDWQLHVSERDFQAWRKLLKGHVAARNQQVEKAMPRKRSCPTNELPTTPLAPALQGLGIVGHSAEEARPVKRARPDTAGGEYQPWSIKKRNSPEAHWPIAMPPSTVASVSVAGSAAWTPAHSPLATSPCSVPRRRQPRLAPQHQSISQNRASVTSVPTYTPNAASSMTNKHLHASHLQPVNMGRSLSADSSPVPLPAQPVTQHFGPPFLPPHSHFTFVPAPTWSQITPPHDHVPMFAFNAPGNTAASSVSLADAYSPANAYGFNQPPATLGFYTLGAAKGVVDAVTCHRPYVAQPQYVPNPLLLQQQLQQACMSQSTLMPVTTTAYSNAGLPGSWWDAQHGCWRTSFSPTMPSQYC